MDLSLDPVRDFNFTILSRDRDLMTRQLEEVVRVAKALSGNKYTDNKNVEVEVHCLNRRGETFEPNRRWDPDSLPRKY